MISRHHLLVLTLTIILTLHKTHCELNSAWRWECVSGFCQKKQITPDTEDSALSLSACRLFCAEKGALWPKPSGKVELGNYLLTVNVDTIEINGGRVDAPIGDLVKASGDNFKNIIHDLIPDSTKLKKDSAAKTLVVTLAIQDQDTRKLTLETDESYTLQISETSDGKVNATIQSETYFGGRHGLETLGQLIIYDDLRNEAKLPRDGAIIDKPAYPHRGILLDTSRNYVSVGTIKNTINGMGASKMNTFHWHITDSHSFPYQSASRPELSKLGAYSPVKVYTPAQVADVVQFGLERGVKVIPEFDAPAHVGEGWQNTDFVTCFNKKPWQDWCVEPPCGQFDPTKSGVYDALEDIYGDMIGQFDPDIFHMGGDEVHFGCWNSTPTITDWMTAQGWGREEADFVKLWDHFQSQALERLYKKAGKEIPVIMWTSTLTQKEYLKYLPKDKYIIQIWTTGTDVTVTNLLENGHRVILSNYDALYLDCGFAGWVADGNNWCSPYIGWQKVYENKPTVITDLKYKAQILGGEATLWTEQADSTSIDSRLWPRAAALAEVLWTNPETSWREAEQRMLVHRERLVARGVNADALEPEWCVQNEENCPTNDLTQPTAPIENELLGLILYTYLLRIVQEPIKL